MHTPEFLITHLQLLPHPEGGYFKETYRSDETISQAALPNRFTGERHFSTGIYFLITGTSFSAFHKIKSDEMWHFYEGSPLYVHIISPNGNYEKVVVGNNLLNGEVFQYTVPAGCWFASECSNPEGFSLVGCTVSPGFDFADFEMAKRMELKNLFPNHSAIIERLCRD